MIHLLTKANELKTCKECGWEDTPDGEPEKLFCPECGSDEWEFLEDKGDLT